MYVIARLAACAEIDSAVEMVVAQLSIRGRE